VAVSVLFWAVPVLGQSATSVAVVDLSSFMMGPGGASVSLGKAIGAMLTTELETRQGVQVIPRAMLNATLREQNLHPSGRIEESEAIAMGRLLGVQYVLHGQATSIVDNLRLDVRVVDVESGKVVTVIKRADRTTGLMGVVVGIADEFSAAVGLPPSSGDTEVVPIPVAATVAFSHGLDFEDMGDPLSATRQFQAALDAHPGHRDARIALERVREESR
jgi:TolB-like protein